MIKNALLSIGLPCLVLVGLGLFTLSGCADPATGATAEVTVSFKSADNPGDGGGGPDVPPPIASGDPGTLKGKITIQGSFQPLAPLVAKGTSAKDAEFCAAQMDIPNETLLVKDGGVANVVIYMDKAPKAFSKLKPTEERVVFDQKNCTFSPHVLLVRTGQPVHVWNSDGAAHNTHTYPKKNTGSGSTVKPGDQTDKNQLVYRKAESQPLAVGCDFHAWMRGYHFPVDHPFAVVTSADGSFELKDIPPGKYRFKVWHEGKFLSRRENVEITSGGTATLNLSYTAEQLQK